MKTMLMSFLKRSWALIEADITCDSTINWSLLQVLIVRLKYMQGKDLGRLYGLVIWGKVEAWQIT